MFARPGLLSCFPAQLVIHVGHHLALSSCPAWAACKHGLLMVQLAHGLLAARPAYRSWARPRLGPSARPVGLLDARSWGTRPGCTGAPRRACLRAPPPPPSSLTAQLSGQRGHLAAAHASAAHCAACPSTTHRRAPCAVLSRVLGFLLTNRNEIGGRQARTPDFNPKLLSPHTTVRKTNRTSDASPQGLKDLRDRSEKAQVNHAELRENRNLSMKNDSG